MFRRVGAILIVLVLSGSAFSEEPVEKSWPLSKLDFGRPVEVARFNVDYTCAVFPVALEFSGDQVHAVYMTGRGSGGDPKLIYQRSPDNGRTWEPPVTLADSCMAHVCRDGDAMWIIAVCGDTNQFRRYGTSVQLFKVDLKSAHVSEPLTVAGEAEEGEPERSYGMVSIAARGDRLMAAIIEDHRNQTGRLPEVPDLEAKFLLSADGGRTWKEHPLMDTGLTGNSSIACWSMMRKDDFAAVLGSKSLMTANLDLKGTIHVTPLEPTGEKSDIMEPFRLRATDDGFLLAYARKGEESTSQIMFTRSVDGRKWSEPVPLTRALPFDLLTPFTDLAAGGKEVAFGYTASQGRWRQFGECSAQIVLSRDGGKTFERVDLGDRFRFGSLLPVTAIDTEHKRIGCLAVALVPAAQNEDMDNFNPGTFSGEAYLIYASSPPVPEVLTPIDAEQAKKVEELIRQLGSPEYRKREEATEALRKLAETVVPLLEKAAENVDMEIATRARMLLKSAYPPWLKPAPTKPAAP